MLRGIEVILQTKTQSGEDAFGHPTYSEGTVTVENVLVSPVSSDQAVNELNLTGKRIAYELSIPKGDTNIWEDRDVTFWGETFHAFDFQRQWIDEMVPLQWNAKVKVERYGKD